MAYWDDYDKVPYAFPHVYDYMEGADAVSSEYPQLVGDIQPQTISDRLRQGAENRFGDILIDRDADGYSSASGIVSIETASQPWAITVR